MNNVRPLVTIYVSRFILGIVSALISATVTMMNDVIDYTVFLNGITIALALYLLSYYIIKAKFASKVEKQSKIMSTGIGIYFFTWLVFWILTYTLLKGPLPVAT